MKKNYDVVIFGGGLAGLTLSLQLKKENENISILVLEKREGDALDAAHKVGESTVELGTHYLREVLDLKDYLEEKQLPKHGLRFFFSPEHKNDIDKRVELGPRELLPVPSHQIDRGTFENDLIGIVRAKGVEVELGAKVTATEPTENGHSTIYSKDKEEINLSSKWIVDATGRNSFLKRKLKLKQDLDHGISSAWFRIKGEIDVDDWSENKDWSSYVKPGLRRLSTVHFMDKGYWIWFIPLATGNTSVGIVADPAIHPFDTYNKLDKAFEWFKKNEPIVYKNLIDKKEDILDFKVLKHFAHSCEKLYSTERWAITGESGLFLDPFYSPGTDFIALNNAFVGDLILRDLKGEDIDLRINVFERTHYAWFENWIPIYQNKYKLWGKTQTMVWKIFWDWAIYWSVHTLLFTNHGYTNIMVLRNLFAKDNCAGEKFGQLNQQMQKLLLEWGEFDDEAFENNYIDPFDIPFLQDFHRGIDEQHSPRELVKKVEDNVKILEHIAVEMFKLMSRKVYGTSMNLKVDPYIMTLSKKLNENENGLATDEGIKNDVAVMWFYKG